MTIIEFFRRLVWHASTAAVVLFIVLCLGEYFIPGFVLPFVDLVDAAVVVILLLVFSALVAPRESEK